MVIKRKKAVRTKKGGSSDVAVQLARRESELRLLSQISKTFWAAVDHQTLSKHMLQMLRKHLDIKAFSVLLMDEVGHKVILTSHHHVPDKLGRQIRDDLLKNYSQHGNTAISPKDVALVKVSADGTPRTKLATPTRLHTVPLMVLERSLGMIGLVLPKNLHLEENDELFVNIMANEVAMFAENARVQQDLVDERNRLASILHSMTSAVLVVDGQQRVVLSNPLMNTIFALRENKIMGQPLGDVIQNTEIVSLFDSIAKQPNEYISQEITVKSAVQDKTMIFRANLAKVRNHVGAIVGTVMVMNDMTREREIDRVRAEFVSVVSHELRTPMAAIKEAVSLIIDGVTGPVNERQVKFLDMAKRNIDRLTGIINDLLDLSKIESGKMILIRERVDPRAVIDEVVATFEPVAHEKEISLLMSVEDKLPAMSIDRSKVNQVLSNLVSNAIKFTPSKGAITVSAKMSSIRVKSVEFCVSDTGIGIDPKDYRKLFQKFQQVDSSLNRMAGGTGLGLAISKEIVELHGGRIWLESEPGRGSKFFFNLPVDERDAKTREKCVLFVTPEANLSIQIFSGLRREGFDVVDVGTGELALDRVNEVRPDLILVDADLPDMSGFELCKKLKEDFVTSLIPVVLLTDMGQEKDVWRALSMGVNGYLVRPVGAKDVLSTIRKLIH